ncbi:MAG: UPF0179 family protein [Candidatus Thermoplasmatota archaeon]|nr:UPF0179 family protein [Euryarchaeota archaeon]MBU4032181.1 UPF0179 family protein [Candidatus Thermoplasmatota archaeon]MBU4071445.1 UPF0179 family protein [Candidatus Thermoplasmatota archaeon]MBU4144397.1 UPF0179 family protein [Candidatus Thermoplasmatota archaeon]MBU4591566.1 UPF0179 family protein [Candidatus Thermoplasmatota archaeon]
MVMLTVIGKKLAKEGMEFVYLGPLSDCKDCKVRNICFHLDRGSRYRVVGLRDVMHDCPLHEEGVRVVQVEPLPRKAVIMKKVAMEGSSISYDFPKCRERGCPHFELCFIPGVDTGQKKKVAKVMENVDCKIGQSRVAVMVE